MTHTHTHHPSQWHTHTPSQWHTYIIAMTHTRTALTLALLVNPLEIVLSRCNGFPNLLHHPRYQFWTVCFRTQFRTNVRLLTSNNSKGHCRESHRLTLEVEVKVMDDLQRTLSFNLLSQRPIGRIREFWWLMLTCRGEPFLCHSGLRSGKQTNDCRGGGGCISQR